MEKKIDIATEAIELIDEINVQEKQAKEAGEVCHNETAYYHFENAPLIICAVTNNDKKAFVLGTPYHQICKETFETFKEALIFIRDNTEYVLIKLTAFLGAELAVNIIATEAMKKNDEPKNNRKKK